MTTIRRAPVGSKPGGRFLLAALALSLGALLSSAPANAVIHSVAAGAGAAVPLGDAYINYGRNPAFLLEVEDREPFSDAFHLVATAEYTPLSIRNIVNGSAKISVWGLYVGLQYVSPSESAILHPFVSLQIGGTFNSFGIADSTSWVDNRSLSFATRLNPGIIIPIPQVDMIALELGFPIETLYVKNTLFIWNALGAIRIRL